MTDITWTNDTRRLADLVPWENNPKRMSKKQADGLRLSIERFGFAVPFLVSPAGDIYDGHQRQTLMGAIKDYGPDAVVDVRVSSRPLTDDERRELVVRLKQNQAGWDFDMLPNLYEREELIEWGFEEAELGLFPDDEPTGDDPGPQIDLAEELREKWGVETGQLWQLGEHRLICGDCTDAAVVARVMGGEVIGAIIADPPYGMRLDADFSGMINRLDFAREKGVKSGRKYDDVIGDDTDFDANRVLSVVGDVDDQLWFGADYYAPTLPDTAHSGAWLVWDKRLDETADRMFGSCFELIWSRRKCRREILRHKWAGIFGTEHEPQRGRQHPNQKPVVLLEDLVRRTGGNVYDPFLGSGTTLIACERLGRRCRAVEISPAYVAVCLERFYQMSGKLPVLISDAVGA